MSENLEKNQKFTRNWRKFTKMAKIAPKMFKLTPNMQILKKSKFSKIPPKIPQNDPKMAPK
jgi:hypothetical protein